MSVTGYLLALLIPLAAYRVRALSRSGALAAVGLGLLVFGLGGLPASILLVAFFASASALSFAFKRRKTRFAEKFSKGARRDAAQVLANGGPAGLFILLHALFPTAAWTWWATAAALAAANADTWATELGVLGRQPPRLISSGRVVEAGTSGAISAAGTLAAAAGALFIAALAVLFSPYTVSIVTASFFNSAAVAHALANQWPHLLVVAAAGTAGSLLDSLLGATVQAVYYCPACAKPTERHPRHTCGAATTLQRGWRWMGNDAVNALSSAAGGAAAALVWFSCIWPG